MAGSTTLAVALRFLWTILINADLREDLNVGEAVVNIVQDLLMKLVKDLQNLFGCVTLSALGNKPSRNRSRWLTASVLTLVRAISKCSRSSPLATSRLLVIKSLRLSLADGQLPVNNLTREPILLVVLRPVSDFTDLLLDEIALKFGILLGITVAAALIVLAAVEDPYVIRNKTSAHLVAAKDVGYCLSQGGTGVAVGDVHADRLGLLRLHIVGRWSVRTSILEVASRRSVVRVLGGRRSQLCSRAHGMTDSGLESRTSGGNRSWSCNAY